MRVSLLVSLEELIRTGYNPTHWVGGSSGPSSLCKNLLCVYNCALHSKLLAGNYERFSVNFAPHSLVRYKIFLSSSEEDGSVSNCQKLTPKAEFLKYVDQDIRCHWEFWGFDLSVWLPVWPDTNWLSNFS